MFREEFLSELLNVNIDENGSPNFVNTCKKILNYHALCKQKNAQGNHLSFSR